MLNATLGDGLSGQVSNKTAGSGGTLTLRLLLCVKLCWDVDTSIVLCVTAEETLPVFHNSLVPTKCLTRVELTCPMIIPLVPLYADDLRLDACSGGQNLKENIKEESQAIDITVIRQVRGVKGA